MRNVLVGSTHAAFEHVADTELARDLLHIEGSVLAEENRAAGDDEQPADPGKAPGVDLDRVFQFSAQREYDYTFCGAA